jgi:hypothetical protein
MSPTIEELLFGSDTESETEDLEPPAPVDDEEVPRPPRGLGFTLITFAPRPGTPADSVWRWLGEPRKPRLPASVHSNLSFKKSHRARTKPVVVKFSI